jgi:hypothetical protein
LDWQSDWNSNREDRNAINLIPDISFISKLKSTARAKNASKLTAKTGCCASIQDQQDILSLDDRIARSERLTHDLRYLGRIAGW